MSNLRLIGIVFSRTLSIRRSFESRNSNMRPIDTRAFPTHLQPVWDPRISSSHLFPSMADFFKGTKPVFSFLGSYACFGLFWPKQVIPSNHNPSTTSSWVLGMSRRWEVSYKIQVDPRLFDSNDDHHHLEGSLGSWEQPLVQTKLPRVARTNSIFPYYQ
ncbi:hypothetical protein CRG98_001966 [Punica granatum]|uniref:Uncharacterized protein n=1 Tax=Punica granatum TaxID=22663 RepID=A0A2I0LAB1_PUNGR|nr:hypothetical protein CRG98_001966 [Punica granatum]